MKESTSIDGECPGGGCFVQGESFGAERVVTPEAVALELDIAGLGSRMIAIMIDGVIQVAIVLVVALVMAGLDVRGSAELVIWVVTSFCAFWGYFFVFEGLWQGQTPGKRAQRLRAVRTDGHPMSGAQMFVRNLVRIVDFLPTYYGVGAISVVLTRRSQRLGDLAAGTLVIRERRPVLPIATADAFGSAGGRRVDVAAMTEAQYQLVRSFLARRSSLDPAARHHVATQIADAIRPVVGPVPAGLQVEQHLESVAAAYRTRSAGSPLPPPPGTPSAF
jgi:uncharacterized RDD family membrane protein YckC